MNGWMDDSFFLFSFFLFHHSQPDYVTNLHMAPRFGHTNRLGKLASLNPKDALDYAGGVSTVLRRARRRNLMSSSVLLTRISSLFVYVGS